MLIPIGGNTAIVDTSKVMFIAPYAYDNTFTVICFHSGERILLRVSKNELEQLCSELKAAGKGQCGPHPNA